MGRAQLLICHVIYSVEWEIDHIIVLRGTWFVIISPLLAGRACGPHYCIRNAQAVIGHPRSGHFTASCHLPDLLMTTEKDKRKAIYDRALLAAGWAPCDSAPLGYMSRDTRTSCVLEDKKKKCLCVFVSATRTLVYHELYAIFLSKRKTFIEKELPGLAETQQKPFSY